MSNRTRASEQTLSIIACIATKSIAVRFVLAKFVESEFCAAAHFPRKAAVFSSIQLPVGCGASCVYALWGGFCWLRMW
jgi:hypothetical protein